MKNLLVQQNKDRKEHLIPMDNTSGTYKDIKFIVSNNVWQNSEINAGLYFIRPNEMVDFYKEISEVIPDDSLDQQTFEETVKEYCHKEDDLDPNYLFINFEETENLPRQLVNIIDKELSNN